LITDRKNSLVIELKDEDDSIDKYYHFLRQKEKNENDKPIASIQSESSTIVGIAISSNSKSTVLSYISIFETLWKQTELYQQLKQADILKTEFIDIAAHELRTPTQSIIGYCEMLEAFPEKKEDFLNPIKRNAERLYKLTQDILDVAKIELGNLKLERTTFDMNEKINNVIRDLTPKKNLNDNMKNQQNVKFIFQPSKEPIMVFADKQRIFQVISNLLKNALTFIPLNDGKIEIIMEKIRENNEKEFVSVKIRDNGTGIDSQILPRLFQKFTTKSVSGGTGLGLYISKSIVEAHGGKIWAENNSDGKGATFSITLPLSTKKMS
jgi:signal transduction histidine kinase